MSETHVRIESIFLAALEKSSPEERAAFLDEACGDDEVLRRRVERLLAAHPKAADFLEHPPADVALAVEKSGVTERAGSTIGPYELLEQIGEGGFGVVFMAEQKEPIRRKVALKVIKPGMDTEAVIARFEAERKSLALMDHPNVAKILDAGATETGRPYFVMDLVRGIPVTEYCDQNELTTKERLGIFVDVCQAVQHAHQKGIIHRDLKPSNVLVTQQDGKPIPKVIDFGVAKAIEQRLTEKTHFTEHRQLVGTPEYMSPEQATFCDADVDTRSDIYSLGVLLYELLVGTTPFDAEALRSRGYDEICRVIRESDAPTPSKRLSTLGDAVSEISKHRHVEPAALRKLLCGDLDWIAMKALEKDRTRRYETVHGLARDIERHLHDEPVNAHPPSTGYRLKRYVRKHRFGVAATVAVLAALVVGLALTEHQRRVAIDERNQARENLRVASQLMRDMIWPATGRMVGFQFPEDEQDVLEQARVFSERILQQSDDDPELRREMATIHHRLGWIARETGQDPEPEFRRSLSILTDLVEEFPSNPHYRAELGELHGWLCTCYAEDLRLEEAVQQRRISLNIRRDLAAEFPSSDEYHQSLLTGNYHMGWRLKGIGHFDEALKYHHAALAADGGLTPWQRVESRVRYADLLLRLARYEAADLVLQEARQIAEDELARNTSPTIPERLLNSLMLALCHDRIGLLDLQMGRFTEAEQHLRQAIERITLSSDHRPRFVWLRWGLGWSLHNLAEVLTAMGRLEEAEEARHQSLTVWESVSTAVPATFAHGKGLAHYRLGELLHGTGRTEEARHHFVQARAIMEDVARRRPEEWVCHWQLICLLANCPNPALRDPPRAVTLAKHVIPAQVGHYWRYLALAQYRSDQWQDAADSIQQAMDLRQGGDALDWLLLAMTRWQLGQKEKAIEWHTKALEAIKAGKPIFYEYLGVMAVERLRREAEMLLDDAIEGGKQNEGG